MSLEAWGDENPFDAETADWQDAAIEAGWIDPSDYSAGAIAILHERDRQEVVEGHDAAHDDAHTDGELVIAAAAYALATSWPPEAGHPGYEAAPPTIWPLDTDWWKPGPTRERMLEKAGALIAAELDRLYRQKMRAAS